MLSKPVQEKAYTYIPAKTFKESAFFQRRLEIGAVSLILVAAAALRLYGLTAKSLWWDEIYDIMAVRPLNLLDSLTYYDPYNLHPGLFKAILNLWINTIGIAEFQVRVFSVVVSMLLLALVYYLTRRWFDIRIALTSTLLLAVSPLQLFWSQSIRPYAWLTLLVAISMGLTYQVSEKPRQNWYWVAYGLSMLAMIYTHYLGFYVIFSQILFLLVVLYKNWGAILRLAITLAGVVVAFLPWLDHFLSHNEMSHTFFSSLSDNRGWSTVLEAVEMLSSWFIPNSLTFVAGGVALPLYLVGLVWLWQNQRKLALFLVSWGLLPVIMAWLSGLIRSNYTIHYYYMAFCLPGFLIVMAAGIWSLKKQSRFAPYLLVGLCVALSLAACWNYRQNYQYQDWRELANYVATHREDGDVVLMADLAVYGFDYYYVYNFGSPGNIERKPMSREPSSALRIAEIFKNHPRVWIVRWYINDPDWLLKNVMDNIPTNYSSLYYQEYPSNRQGAISLILYGRNK